MANELLIAYYRTACGGDAEAVERAKHPDSDAKSAVLWNYLYGTANASYSGFAKLFKELEAQ